MSDLPELLRSDAKRAVFSHTAKAFIEAAARIEELEAKLERVRELPGKWKEDQPEGRMDYYEGYCDASHKRADELSTALTEETP